MEYCTGPGAVQERFLNKQKLANVYRLMLRFREERNRLEVFIRWAAGSTIGGSKPASLVRIPRNGLDQAWNTWGAEICRNLAISVIPLRESAIGILVLLYRRRRLTRRALTGAAARYLRSVSYPVEFGLGVCLDYLKSRFSDPGGFPHEVGIFLGYPLEDVISFSAGKSSPYTCHGYWKVYFRPEKAERTFAYMDAARLKSVGEFFTTGNFFGSPGITRTILEGGLPLTSLGKPLSASDGIWVI